jgi:hypothetical protein
LRLPVDLIELEEDAQALHGWFYASLLDVSHVNEEKFDELRGWANYFRAGTVSNAYRAIDSYTVARLRRWLRTKFKKRRQRGGGYPPSILYDRLGLVRLTWRGRNRSWAKA